MKKMFRNLITGALCATLLFTSLSAAGATSSYWGYDDYKTFKNPDCDELTSHKTVVTKLSESEYSFVSETEAGKITITMKEMQWGTFNLWTWKLVDKNNTTHTFVSGGTDWEYVYRTGRTKTDTLYFTGGNHGNEALISFEMYDGESGKKLDFTSAKSYTVNQLHIIEKTKLLWIPDANGDSIGDYVNKNMSYTDSDVFAEVTRKYTITGPQVRLNVDYKYTQDTYHGVSYTCMFPVAKKYALYADMIGKDGDFVKTVVTSEVGKADYSGPMNSGNKATRAILYGKNNSQYQFDVHINTYEDSLESQKNSFLTAFWDMNTTQNKLYFSKGDNTARSKYAKGSAVHTECVWRFVYDKDGRKPTESESTDNAGPLKNLATGKKYDISVTDKNPGAPQYNTSYLANLTDGVATDEFNASNDSWFAFSAYLPNIENGKGTVTVHLEDSYNITKLRAHLFNNVAGMGVKAPKAVCAYALVDGKYEKICDFNNISQSDITAYWISADVKDVVTDTIKFEFTLDGGFMYLNEVEVHGGEAEVEKALKGDIDASGDIDVQDYILVKRACMDTLILDEAQSAVADVNGDCIVDPFDYILIKRHVMNTFDIESIGK